MRARAGSGSPELFSAWVESDAAVIGDTAPTTPSKPTIDPASPLVATDLTASLGTGSTDADSDTITYYYEWQKNGGAWGDAGRTLDKSKTAKGESWKVRVRAGSGSPELFSAWVESDAVTIGDAAPTAPSKPTTSPATPLTADDLTSSEGTGSTDADSDAITYTYEWQKNGGSWGDAGRTLDKSKTAKGESWKVRVRAGSGSPELFSAWVESDAVVIGDTGPTAPSKPTISPASPSSGDDLAASPGTGSTDADGDAIAYTYQWQKDGGSWGDPGRILSNSRTTKGESWKVRVRAGSGAHVLSSPWVESDAVTIVNAPPTAPTLVVVTPDDPGDGDSLTAAASGSTDIDAGDTVVYRYEWSKSSDGIVWSSWGHPGQVLPGSLTRVGEHWRARAQASDGMASSAWLVGDPVMVVSMVRSADPAANAVSAVRRRALTLTLRWPVTMGTAESRFSVTGPGSAVVPGTLTWPKAFTTLRFTPSAPLAAGTRYTVNLAAGISRRDSRRIGWAESYSFTSGNEPIVIACQPTSSAVPTDSVVTVTFDQAMHRVSVQSTFNIRPYIAGSFSWRGTQLAFKPVSRFAVGQSYKVTIGAMARSGAGIPMGLLYSFRFTTAATSPAPSLALSASGAPLVGGAAEITVCLTTAATVDAQIRNLAGTVVALLPARDLAVGVNSVHWERRSLSGTRVPAGRYLVEVRARSSDGGTARCLVPLNL